MTLLDQLHAALARRLRPEDVARLIATSTERGVLDLDGPTRRLLIRIGREALRPTFMSTDFEEAVGPERQLAVARALFPDVPAPERVEDPEQLHALLARLAGALRVSGHDFLRDRANRAGRRLVGLLLGHRAYNKRFRLLTRLAAKEERWRRSLERHELARVAKVRLAGRVRREELTDLRSACLVAYLTARAGVRSVFTAGKQDRPFDELCAALLAGLDARRADWWAIALVHPAREVVEHLPLERQGQLLGLWFDVLERAAWRLQALVARGGLDLERLIVRRGNDSSSWNEAAGAFNRARDGWVATLHAMGAEALLDDLCPGKALRLMAADVAWLHRRSGGGLDPDTAVWAALPRPWDVVLGQAGCGRATVEEACRKAGVEGRGWVTPRVTTVARWRPTPELVHGVEVGSPTLAALLRRAGAFGGPSKAKAIG